ncbi:nucleotide exchange factor GrpE [Phytohabitans sp. LJ34]|uniref:nucleotide exchange factor GrpE n=1 Tax=Phytohabitans sp. LJ34 TaxID=3452217 RepID=UPI003F8AAE10
MSSARDDGQAAERVVIRDKRKIDPSGGKTKEAETAEPDQTDAAPVEATKDSATPDGPAKKERKPSHAAPEPDEETSTVDEPAPEEKAESAPPLGAELEALRSELEERTRDLQRVTAEYANYRKRVDRDRGVQAEQATGLVISALLPVLDDLDRAREHGDLVGPFAAVAEQLVAALGKFGLTAFGEKGDPFDPTRHEAVAHRTSSEVTEPTCVEVMRRGYLLGDRLLRAALVAVADPE